MNRPMSRARRHIVEWIYSPDVRTVIEAYLGKSATESFDVDAHPDIARIISSWALDPHWEEWGYSALDAAAAQIALRRIQSYASDFTPLKAGEPVHERPNCALPGPSDQTFLKPVFLFAIDWALSAPGVSWPEAYYATWLPGYNVFVVTMSHDTDEAMGVSDLAIGVFSDANIFERACRIVVRRHWKRAVAFGESEIWEHFLCPGRIDEETVRRQWAQSIPWARW